MYAPRDPARYLFRCEDPNASGDPFKTLFVGRISREPHFFFRVEGCIEAMFKLHLIYITLSFSAFGSCCSISSAAAVIFFKMCAFCEVMIPRKRSWSVSLRSLEASRRRSMWPCHAGVNPEQFEADFIEMKEKFNFSYENEGPQFWCLEFQEFRF